MFENAFGRLVSGALWGLGAGMVITLTRDGAPGLRTVTRGLIKGYLAVADRVQEVTAEARDGLDDIAAEVRAEQKSSVRSGPATKSLATSKR